MLHLTILDVTIFALRRDDARVIGDKLSVNIVLTSIARASGAL